MLNIGGLVEYPRAGRHRAGNCSSRTRGSAGQRRQEAQRAGGDSRNLGAPFGGGKTIIAGADLTCAPIDLSKHANQYRTERGWFGDARFTLKDLPVGEQKFAGVTYDIYEFRTSPVPTCIMLGGPTCPTNCPKEVRGIPVNRKADALFFLHTARVRPAPQREGEEEGRTARDAPLRRPLRRRPGGGPADLRRDGHRRLPPEAAAALPGAQMAWTRPYEGTDFQRPSTPSNGTIRGPTWRLSFDMLPGRKQSRDCRAAGRDRRECPVTSNVLSVPAIRVSLSVCVSQFATPTDGSTRM